MNFCGSLKHTFRGVGMNSGKQTAEPGSQTSASPHCDSTNAFGLSGCYIMNTLCSPPQALLLPVATPGPLCCCLAVEPPWVCNPRSKLQGSGSQSVASTPWEVVKMQMNRLYSRHTKSGALRTGPSKLFERVFLGILMLTEVGDPLL